jgi:hypothetical protein
MSPVVTEPKRLKAAEILDFLHGVLLRDEM